MKVGEGMEVELHSSLTLALDEGEWSASHPGPIYHQNNIPVCWADCTAGLNGNFFQMLEIEPWCVGNISSSLFTTPTELPCL